MFEHTLIEGGTRYMITPYIGVEWNPLEGSITLVELHAGITDHVQLGPTEAAALYSYLTAINRTVQHFNTMIKTETKP